MPDEEKEPRRLLDDLATVAAGLTPADLPSAITLDRVLGALVKVLDAGGTKVEDDLLNPPDAVPAPAGPARPPETGAAQHDPTRLDRLEHKLEKLLDALHEGDDEDKPSPVAAPPPPSPPPATSGFSAPSSGSSSDAAS